MSIEMTAEHWDAAADYLDECLECGKKHEYLPINNKIFSWVDPDDHHVYRPRRNFGVPTNMLRKKADELRGEVEQ